MKKLSVLIVLVMLLLLPALPVAADPPIPNYYFVDAGGSCWLPDGKAMPSRANGTSTSYWFEKHNIVVITCAGKLPAGASLPTMPVKYDYSSTGLFCAGKLKEGVGNTTSYGAVVYPDGYSQITCRFDLSAQDP